MRLENLAFVVLMTGGGYFILATRLTPIPPLAASNTSRTAIEYEETPRGAVRAIERHGTIIFVKALRKLKHISRASQRNVARNPVAVISVALDTRSA